METKDDRVKGIELEGTGGNIGSEPFGGYDRNGNPAGSSIFAEALQVWADFYPLATYEIPAQAQKNGNISQLWWRVRGRSAEAGPHAVGDDRDPPSGTRSEHVDGDGGVPSPVDGASLVGR